MDKVKLSIITICLNAEKTIDKTIESVLHQSVPVYEYIVIDGNSSDSTYDIICAYDQKFAEKGISYTHISEKDKGISDAFNKGIQKASGNLIGIINADDELIRDANEILQKRSIEVDADIFYGNCIWEDEKRNVSYISKPKHDFRKLLYNMILIHPSTFVKKSAYQDCGLFDISYKLCMDKELLYRMYLAGKQFEYIDKSLTKVRSGGVSDNHARAVFREESRMEIEAGEPRLKVKIVQIKKILRRRLVDIIKDTKLYQKNKKPLNK